MDQARDLRNIMNQRQAFAQQPQELVKSASRIITVTSGKGGVGKTNFTVNLALWLAEQGLRVIIIDADFGLANIEVLFNVWPRYCFADVVNGAKTIPEILTDAPKGIKFLSGGSGFKDLANVSDRQMSYILDNLSYLDEISDIILIDTGAGISKTVTTFVQASNEAVVISTAEPTSISDSYTLLKAAYVPDSSSPEFKILLNRVDSAREAEEVFNRLKGVSEKFLKLTPSYLGYIASDNDLVKAVKNQKPVLLSYPNSSFSRNIESVGRRMLDGTSYSDQNEEKQGILSFIKRIKKAFSS